MAPAGEVAAAFGPGGAAEADGVVVVVLPPGVAGEATGVSGEAGVFAGVVVGVAAFAPAGLAPFGEAGAGGSGVSALNTGAAVRLMSKAAERKEVFIQWFPGW